MMDRLGRSAARRGVASQVLFIGQWRAGCFRDSIELTRRCAAVTAVDDVDEAVRVLRRGASPRWIVLAQTRRGVFRESDLDRLRGRAPLACVINLLGPWLEGETRTGVPLRGAVRVYWHEWTSHFERQWKLSGPIGGWSQPGTYSVVDRGLVDNPYEAALGVHGGVRSGSVDNGPHVAIVTETHFAFEALRDAISPATASVRWILRRHCEQAQLANGTTLLWDACYWDEAERIALSQTAGSQARLETILLLSWPRPEDVATAKQCGVQEVISKPHFRSSLLSALATARSRTIRDDWRNEAG